MSYKSYIFSLLVGSLFGITIYLLQPTLWEAHALISPAKIYQPVSKTNSQNQSIALWENIEPLSTTLERINSQSFRSEIVKKAQADGIAKVMDSSNCSCINAKPLKTDDAFNLLVKAKSAQLASTAAKEIFALLKVKQDQLVNDYKKPIDLIRVGLNNEISSISKNVIYLRQTMLNSDSKRPDPIATSMLIMTLEADVNSKKTQDFLLQEKLSNFELRSTTLLESISVKQSRIIDSPMRALLFGALLGLFICFLIGRVKTKV